MLSPPWDNPPVCQNCGSADVAWVMQGLPASGFFEDADVKRALDEARLLMGDCCMGDFWRCNDCAREKVARTDGAVGDINAGNNIFAGYFDPHAAERTAERAEEAAERAEQAAREEAILATPRGAFDHVKSLVASAEDDVRKAERRNKAAGARVRRLMREVKTGAQKVRIAILVARSGNGGREETSGLKESQR